MNSMNGHYHVVIDFLNLLMNLVKIIGVMFQLVLLIGEELIEDLVKNLQPILKTYLVKVILVLLIPQLQ